MKILQLNVWMGEVEGNLKRFLADNDFDVICMQEVMSSTDAASTHVSRLCFDAGQIIATTKMPYQFFSPNWGCEIVDGTMQWGNLILSKIPFRSTHSEFINGEYNPKTKLGQTVGNNLNVQIAELENGFTVVNHHGFWRPNPIGDNDTIAAHQRVAAILKQLENPLVVCGDFNIIHESPAMRAYDFMRDLTHENHVKTTLSGLKYDGDVACDHILVSNDVKVKSFTVHPELVSDHLGISVDVEN